MDDTKDYGTSGLIKAATYTHIFFRALLIYQLTTIEVLLLLGVAPTHQRMGLGTLLINEGLAIADEKNAKTYIEASPKGLGLYLKHGWKLVDEIVLDMRQYGDSGVAKEQCLIRKPGGK